MRIFKQDQFFVVDQVGWMFYRRLVEKWVFLRVRFFILDVQSLVFFLRGLDVVGFGQQYFVLGQVLKERGIKFLVVQLCLFNIGCVVFFSVLFFGQCGFGKVVFGAGFVVGVSGFIGFVIFCWVVFEGRQTLEEQGQGFRGMGGVSCVVWRLRVFWSL